MDRFDAFISYAHEDAATAVWLAKMLAGYWVPGRRRRRRIFLDKNNLAAGVLDEELKRNLRDSRVLVVCASRHARDSEWVDQEVAEFIAARGAANVLACRVGDPGDDAVPRSIENLRLLVPDLRGKPKTGEAVALLPKIVGLQDKDEIVARRKKRAILSIAALVAAIVIAITSIVAWKRWLRTPAGAHYTTLRRVLAATRTERIDDPVMIPTAEAVGATDGLDAVRGITAFIDDRQWYYAARAAGYLSLRPNADCAAAVEYLRMAALNKTLRAESGRGAARPFLLAQARCGGDWIDTVRPSVIDGAWIISLGEAGLAPPPAGPATRPKIEAAIAFGVATRRPIAVTAEMLEQWAATDESFDVYEAMSVVRRIENSGAVNDPAAAIVARFALKVIRERGSDFWTDLNLIARVLAPRDPAATRALLDEVKRLPEAAVYYVAEPSYAGGWASNAVAWHRLGDRDRAAEAFRSAERCAHTIIPASRTWDEWREIALAYAATNQWEKARLAAESAGNERVRILHLCKLLEAWARR
jgi:TIR domain